MMLTWRRTTLTAVSPLRWLSPARWMFGAQAEPIDVSARRYGYAPWRFRHRGDLRRVCAIESVRERGGRSPRRYFQVCCADGGRHTLVQDLRAGTWHLEP